MIRHIPNTLTSINLVFGCFSIIAALNGRLMEASACVGAAAVVDFFDGFVARALKVQSEIGKQLDSLADAVSFGVAPGMIFFSLSAMSFSMDYTCINTYIVMLIPVFSIIRLAKFNLDTRQTDSFIGVPTPANSIFIGSLPFIIEGEHTFVSDFVQNPWFLTIFPFVSAYMLVCELPLIALKFKNFSWEANKVRFIFLALSVATISLLGFTGVALSIILYILISIINNIQHKTS